MLKKRKKRKSPRDPHQAERLNLLHETAQHAGHTCLDSVWRGMQASYHFHCAHGHAYRRSAKAVAAYGVLCTACHDGARLAAMQEKAAQHGGRCLEVRYLGLNAYHRFVCALGHRWSVKPPHSVRAMRQWCKRCGHLRLTQLRFKGGLERLQRVAQERGGVCLSTHYDGLKARYTFRCAAGHQWDATGTSMVCAAHHWCKRCASAQASVRNRLADGLERLQAAAHAKGGVCLSTHYTHAHAYYHMRCAQGHEWHAMGNFLMHGTWCRLCSQAARRGRIEDMQAIAQARGGRCLSTVFLNERIKLAWVCHRGHAWHTSPAVVKRGCWCPECASMDRITSSKSKARRRYRAATCAP